MVGEAGPELVYLPRGSRVVPNSQVDSHDTYNFYTQEAAAVALTRQRRAHMTRRM